MCHRYDYSGWMERKMDMTKEWTLKTLSHIFDEADKEGLTEDETSQVKDCWTILAMIDGFSHHMGNSNGENGESSNGSAAEVAARTNGTVLK